MARADVTIEICGMSGDGTIAAGGLLNAAMSRCNYSVLAFDSYPADIRGFGRCVTRSRLGDREQIALSDSTDVLVSLDDEQSLSRLPFLTPEAVVIFDSNPPSAVPEDHSIAAHVEPNSALFAVPFRDLATGATGSARGRNLAALGALAGICGLPTEAFGEVIKAKFDRKGAKVVEANIKSFQAGLRYVQKEFADRLRRVLPPPEAGEGPELVLMSGNTAIAEGALAAGLKNYFGYPITPATPIMEYLAAKLPERGGHLLQMEDEISAIGAVLGSFYAGARAMTATSGPGFALMTELITHGVMSETPAVIVNAQRGGPATGLPTKTEQSDLHAAVFGGPGDSARIVIAPSNVSECYYYTAKAFQLAEKYQTPVIVLTDFFLDNRVENIVPPRASEADLADGNLYPDESQKGAYQRFRFSDSGISPRSLPGMEGLVFAATGLEHNQQGVPTFTPEIHMKMSQKRHRKIEAALADLYRPESFYGDGEMELGLVSWGSTFGAVLEATRVLKERGRQVGALKVTSLYPFHAEVIADFMSRCQKVLIPELNYEGQFANLVGHLYAGQVIRQNLATGTPLTPSDIIGKMAEILGEGS